MGAKKCFRAGQQKNVTKWTVKDSMTKLKNIKRIKTSANIR